MAKRLKDEPVESDLSDLSSEEDKKPASRGAKGKGANSKKEGAGERAAATAGSPKKGAKARAVKGVKVAQEDEEDSRPTKRARSARAAAPKNLAETNTDEEEYDDDEVVESSGKKPTAKGKSRTTTSTTTSKRPSSKDDAAAADADDVPSKKKRQSKKDKQSDMFSPATIAEHPRRAGPSALLSLPASALKSAGKFYSAEGIPSHFIGAHTSASGGPEFALLHASTLGARALALFLKNQRRWESKPFEEENVTRFTKMLEKREDGGLEYTADHILPHGSYLINLGNPDKSKREVSYQCFVDDLKRCEQLGIRLYNWHPGSTVGACTKSEALKNVAESINRAHKETSTVVCVIENMAGAGNILGSTWEELAEIISHVEDKSRVGVCIDTCHAFAAGYDIRTRDTYEESIQSFDDIVGLKYLKGMHINDSQGGGLGCHKDRHQNIGLGEIGLSGFRYLVQDRRLAGIPLILETPSPSDDIWKREIELLYELQEVEGTEKEVEVKLKEMTEEWRKLRDEIKKKNTKAEPKTAKKGKKGKAEAADGDEADSCDEE